MLGTLQIFWTEFQLGILKHLMFVMFLTLGYSFIDFMVFKAQPDRTYGGKAGPPSGQCSRHLPSTSNPPRLSPPPQSGRSEKGTRTSQGIDANRRVLVKNSMQNE